MTPAESFERTVEKLARHRAKLIAKVKGVDPDIYADQWWSTLADLAREDLTAIGLGPGIGWIAPWEATEVMEKRGREELSGWIAPALHAIEAFAAMRDARLAEDQT